MKKRHNRIPALLLVIVIVGASALGVFVFYIGKDIDYELDESLFKSAKSSNTVNYLAYNELGEMYSVYKESGGPMKSWVSLDNVSSTLVDAFLSAEDRTFYEHRGINVKRSALALANHIFHFTGNFGGSTITQQVIKNLSGNNEHTVRRKLIEGLRAIHLELVHGKDEILEMYLNLVPMSGNLYGVNEASLAFFGKEPKDLDVAEAATIVGIANAPGRYDPRQNPEECKKKRNTVLSAMLDFGVIDKKTYNEAVERPLGVNVSEIGKSDIGSWFVETAREDVIRDLSYSYSLSRSAAILLLKSGTDILLTVNSAVQDVLDEFFENEANFSPELNNGLEYAMVVSDSKSGDIVGIIGATGKKSGNRLLNYATALHPPASTLKPLALYAPMLEMGKITWSTIIDDSPESTIENNGQITGFYPRNSPDVYEGRITVAEALKKSKNTAALALYRDLGSNKIYKSLFEKMGFDTLVKGRAGKDGRIYTDIAPAPLAMGQLTDGVSLIKLTEAYTAFPREGVIQQGRTYYGVFDRSGKVILDNARNDKRIFSKSTAQLMNMMLSEVATSGTARTITLKESVDTAAKTGTSASNKDKLLIGYTPYFTAGIWCGYRDGKGVFTLHPNHIEIWDNVMKNIHEKCAFSRKSDYTEGFNQDEIRKEVYCTQSGKRASEGCIKIGCIEEGYYLKDGYCVDECPIHGE